jgi:chaperonin GroES
MSSASYKNFTPYGERLLVKPQEIKETKANGFLMMPHSTNENKAALLGTVLAIGSGTWSEKDVCYKEIIGIDVNDVVIYGRYDGTEIEIDGEKLVILPSHNVYGVLHTEGNTKTTEVPF